MAKLSLQEQMLKAGLVNQKKLKKAAKTAKKSRLQAREAKAAVEEKRAAQVAQDKELNRQKNEEAMKVAIAAQIKQLIEMNRIDRTRGDISYKFTDGTLIKHIHVDKTTQNELVKGHLAIVRFGENYEVIPAVVADKISLRDEDAVVLNNTLEEKDMDEDDPYADFVVPDDLMW